MIKDTDNYVEEQIKDAFQDLLKEKQESIVNIFSLIVYNNANTTDIINLYKNFDMDNFLKVIDILGGHTVYLPDRETMREDITLAILYYYREIKGYSWNKIRNLVDFEVQTVKYGLRIKSLSNFIKQKLNETFRKLEGEELDVQE